MADAVGAPLEMQCVLVWGESPRAGAIKTTGTVASTPLSLRAAEAFARSALARSSGSQSRAGPLGMSCASSHPLPRGLQRALRCLQLLHDEVCEVVQSAPQATRTALIDAWPQSAVATRPVGGAHAIEALRSLFVSRALTRAVAQHIADVSITQSGTAASAAWFQGLAAEGLFAGVSPGMRSVVLATLSYGGARALAQLQLQDDAIQTLQRSFAIRVLGVQVVHQGGALGGIGRGGDDAEALDPVGDSDEALARAQVGLLREMQAMGGALCRDRIAIDKSDILRSAERLLVAHSRTTARGAVLEVSFLGEKGSGTGVIREFYSLLARALQAESLGAGGCFASGAAAATRGTAAGVVEPMATGSDVWHVADTDAPTSASPPAAAATGFPVTDLHERLSHHPEGLFPRPLPTVVVPLRVLRTCGLVGRAVGRALQDGRLFPLPLSTHLFAVLQRMALNDGAVLPQQQPSCSVFAATTALSPSRTIERSTGIINAGYGTVLLRVHAAARSVLTDPLLVGILHAYLPHVAAALLPAALRRSAAVAAENAAKFGLADTVGTEEDHVLVSSSSSDDAALLDACLNFEHPGTSADLSKVALAAGGGALCVADAGFSADSRVDACCIDLYVAALVAYTAYGGVHGQLSALFDGFSEVVLDACWLGLAGSPKDLRDLVCGVPTVEWTALELRQHVVASHGYSHSDPAVQWLVAALVDMTQSERSEFLRFATGQPVLPPGGLSNLSPPLTVIRKTDGIRGGAAGHPGRRFGHFSVSVSPEIVDVDVESASSAAAPMSPYDALWISASTCFHQVKLPPFSSPDILRRSLRDAITMSAGLIDLS